MSAQAELGPALPSRSTVYATASRLRYLASLAAELSIDTPRADVRRALRALDEARALLGQSAEDER